MCEGAEVLGPSGDKDKGRQAAEVAMDIRDQGWKEVSVVEAPSEMSGGRHKSDKKRMLWRLGVRDRIGGNKRLSGHFWSELSGRFEWQIH